MRFVGPHRLEARTFALVDTGADETVLPSSMAGPLGVVLGSRLSVVRYGDVELQIPPGRVSA